MCEKFPQFALFFFFPPLSPSETKQKMHKYLTHFGLEVAFHSEEQKEEEKKKKTNSQRKSLRLSKTCIHK